MNYMDYQEEGSVYELPWEYECSDDSNSVLTQGAILGDCLYCRMARFRADFPVKLSD